MYSYFAQFIPEKNGMYSIYFPDIHVATCGDNLENAMFMAEDALRTHIEVCLEENDPIATPSNIEIVREMAEKHCKELSINIASDTFYQYVQTEITEKPMRVNLSFAPKVLKSIDRTAKVYGLSRSAFLTVAAQDYINRSA